MLGRQWVSLCETTAGGSLSTAQPHQHLSRSSDKKITNLPFHAHLLAGTKWANVARSGREGDLLYAEWLWNLFYFEWSRPLERIRHFCSALMSDFANLLMLRYNVLSVCWSDCLNSPSGCWMKPLKTHLCESKLHIYKFFCNNNNLFLLYNGMAISQNCCFL